tara:strand:- start:3373 stop:3708 length:336 start_codon:yes stop_codon:yes gene_type:complete
MAMPKEEQKQKHREAMQRYYRKNREANLEKSRLKAHAYYAKNKDAVKARAKKRRDSRTPEQKAKDVAYMKEYSANRRIRGAHRARDDDGYPPVVLKSYKSYWGKVMATMDK